MTVAAFVPEDTIAVHPSFNVRDLRSLDGALADVRVLVSEQVPPGIAYFISSKPPPKPRRRLNFDLGYLPLRRGNGILSEEVTS